MNTSTTESSQCPVDPARIDVAALNTFTYGLYVVTTSDGEHHNGLVVNTVVQVAAEPCEVSVSINKNSYTCELIRRSRVFTVCVLEQQTPLEFIGRFGFRSGRDVDKFQGVRWHPGSNGCPVLEEWTLAVVEANVLTEVDCGSHVTFVGRVTAAHQTGSGAPLTYAYYHEVKGGKTGKGAANYAASQAGGKRKERQEKMRKYVCAVCGYVYDPEVGDPENGIAPGTPFEKLPDDWVCPVCGAGKDQFEPGE